MVQGHSENVLPRVWFIHTLGKSSHRGCFRSIIQLDLARDPI